MYVWQVWENPSTVSGEDNTASSYTPTFGNSVDEPNSYGKPADPTVADGSNSPEVVYKWVIIQINYIVVNICY